MANLAKGISPVHGKKEDALLKKKNLHLKNFWLNIHNKIDHFKHFRAYGSVVH